MRNPKIILAYDTHRDKPLVSLSFEKDYDFYGKVKVSPVAQWNVETRNCVSLPPGTIKSTIWSQNQTQHNKAPLRAYIQENPGQSLSKTTEIYTHVTQKDFAKSKTRLMMISSILYNFVEYTQPDPENMFNKSTSQNRNINNIEHIHTFWAILKFLTII